MTSRHVTSRRVTSRHVMSRLVMSPIDALPPCLNDATGVRAVPEERRCQRHPVLRGRAAQGHAGAVQGAHEAPAAPLQPRGMMAYLWFHRRAPLTPWKCRRKRGIFLLSVCLFGWLVGCGVVDREYRSILACTNLAEYRTGGFVVLFVNCTAFLFFSVV